MSILNAFLFSIYFFVENRDLNDQINAENKSKVAKATIYKIHESISMKSNFKFKE